MFKINISKYPKDRTIFDRVLRKIYLQDAPYSSATLDVWRHRDKKLKNNFPIRWFFNREVPRFFNRQFRVIDDSIWWVKYRITDRHHIHKIRDMPPGYYDSCDKILLSCFSYLTEYVENGLSGKLYSEKTKSFKFWKRNTSASTGLEYLDWVITDPDCIVGGGGPFPSQSEGAIETKFLYLWWAVDRRNRWEPNSCKQIWDERTVGGKASKSAVDRAIFLENFYEEEDQEMLERLMKIRRTMW